MDHHLRWFSSTRNGQQLSRVSSDDPEMVARAVAKRIAEIRRAKGVTQDQMAEALECATKNYQRIEYGQNVTIKMLARIANALDVSVAEFFEQPTRAGARSSQTTKSKSRTAALKSGARGPARGLPTESRKRRRED
jgi:transcriptional regulator with XRE-family HTH domain